jgi:hypothetical protein
MRCEVWTSERVRNGPAGGFPTVSGPGRLAVNHDLGVNSLFAATDSLLPGW